MSSSRIGAARTCRALQAGTYTIKGKFGPVFEPFEVQVSEGAATRVELGGTLSFKWPGHDCWDIYRGDEFVAYHCGSKEQALQAGTYTIKGKFGPVFEPFEVQIKNGASTQVQRGGVFRFAWPGGDCWDIYRGDEFVAYHCGTKQQALQAGGAAVAVVLRDKRPSRATISLTSDSHVPWPSSKPFR